MKSKMFFLREKDLAELKDCFDLAIGALIKYDPVFYKEKINSLKKLRRKVYDV